MIAVLFTALLAARSFAAETIVVLSDEQPVYRETLAAFEHAFKLPFDLRRAGDGLRLPDDARVVVALGGRAVLGSFPPNVALVYCLAPSVRRPPGHSGPNAEVGMLPVPTELLRRLRGAQKGLKTVGVLWSSPAFESYLASLVQAGEAAGPRVIARRIGSSEDLLESLRALRGKVDALWVPPDPALADPARLKALQSVAQQWPLPFYGATPGFLRYGASAVIGASFADVGRAAAEAANDALNGRLRRRYYPAGENDPREAAR